MRKLALLLLPVVLLAPSAALAGDAGPGYVSDLITVPDSHSVLFNVDGNRTNVPGCAQSTQTRWAIDPTTPHGQAVLATLLTAYSLHKQVSISGTGDCSIQGDTESVRYLHVIS